MAIAYIGMGANLPSIAGTPQATLAAAVVRLTALGRVAARSSLYSTKPVDSPVEFAEQPRFVNAALALETAFAPLALLNALHSIEREFGRDRSAGIVNGPRTLDLDILLYGNQIVSEPRLEIPHPRLPKRGFALIPLNEIAPQARDPRSGKTVAELLKRLLSNFPDTAREVMLMPGSHLQGSAHK